MELTANVGTVRAITGQVREQDAVERHTGKCWHRSKHGKASCLGVEAGWDWGGQTWKPRVGEHRAHLWKPMERGPDGQGDIDLDHGKVWAER